MADPKTIETGASIEEFLATIENPVRRADALALLAMMQRVTGCAPRMWGPSIIGFDSYDYTYESGHSGRSMIVGFSPRKANLTLYIMPGFSGFEALTTKLGKFRTGKSCLYISKLADVDLGVLEEMLRTAVQVMRKRYPRR